MSEFGESSESESGGQELPAELKEQIEQFRTTRAELRALAASGSQDFAQNEQLKKELLALGEPLRRRLGLIIDGREADGSKTLKTFTPEAQCDIEFTYGDIADMREGNWGLDSFAEHRDDDPTFGDRNWN